MFERAPEKPRKGAPCNGCGYCCAAERCLLAIEALGDGPGPCPAMQFEGARFYCGLLREAPGPLQPTIAFLLGIGHGCDADDPSLESQ